VGQDERTKRKFLKTAEAGMPSPKDLKLKKRLLKLDSGDVCDRRFGGIILKKNTRVFFCLFSRNLSKHGPKCAFGALNPGRDKGVLYVDERAKTRLEAANSPKTFGTALPTELPTPPVQNRVETIQ
jgi:hypothetical protein